MIEDIVMFCVTLIKAALAVKDDSEKTEALLMKAQEDLAALRAKAKFG